MRSFHNLARRALGERGRLLFKHTLPPPHTLATPILEQRRRLPLTISNAGEFQMSSTQDQHWADNVCDDVHPISRASLGLTALTTMTAPVLDRRLAPSSWSPGDVHNEGDGDNGNCNNVDKSCGDADVDCGQGRSDSDNGSDASVRPENANNVHAQYISSPTVVQHVPIEQNMSDAELLFLDNDNNDNDETHRRATTTTGDKGSDGSARCENGSGGGSSGNGTQHGNATSRGSSGKGASGNGTAGDATSSSSSGNGADGNGTLDKTLTNCTPFGHGAQLLACCVSGGNGGSGGNGTFD
jgi:hypothetical protein